jgi:hypothetical protein
MAGPRLPDFVEEHHVGAGQVLVGEPFVAVFVLELLDGHRPENLVGRAEPVHQVFERTAVAEGKLELAGNEAFGYARRAQQENTFAGQGRQQRQADGFFLFVNAPLQAFQERLNAFFAGHGCSFNRIGVVFVRCFVLRCCLLLRLTDCRG